MQSLLIAFQHSGYVQHGIFTFPALALIIGLLFSYWLSLTMEAAKVEYGVSVVSHYVAWNAVRESFVDRLGDISVRKLEVYSFIRSSKTVDFPPVVLR